jgi:type II secretory pathway pseudopilin PulG
MKHGIAAMGREKDAIELGKMYGLTLDETKNILGDVRSRRSTFGRTIEGKTLSQMLSEARDRKEQRKQRQQEQQQEQQRQQQEQQRQQQILDDQKRRQQGQTGSGRDDGGTFGYDPSQGTSTGDTSDDTSISDVGSEEDPGGTDYGDTGTPETSGLFKTGGRIGMQEGGNTTEVVQPAGFIAPDPNATDQQEIADDKPMDARQGDFIINAPAAEEAGKQDIQRMINTAITNLQEKGVDVRFGDPKINIADKVKLLVSRNEVYIPAIIAKEIGYDRLRKINNRGKREVQRRQEESQQDEKPQARGFIEKKEGDVVATADYSEGGIDATSGMLLRLTGHLKNIEQGLGEGFKYGKKSKAGDTLRHILTSGYISEDGFFNKFMSDLFDGREIDENMSEENKIDLNNNKFGRLLRQKYPDRMEFTKQARQVVKDLLKGKKTEIDGVSPMLSVKAE